MLGLQYKWYGNKSDMYSLTSRASKSFDSQSKVESSHTENLEGGLEYTPCTASHNHILDIWRIVCTWSKRSPDKCAKPHEAIKLQFLTVCYLQVKRNVTLIWKAKGFNTFYEKILIALKQDRSELIPNMCVPTFCEIRYQGGHTCYPEACSLTSGKHRKWLGMWKQMT